MSKLRPIIVAVAVTLPLAVFAGDPWMIGHPNMKKAHAALKDADHWIAESQKANEHVWGDEGGHGKKAKEHITQALHELDLAALWTDTHH